MGCFIGHGVCLMWRGSSWKISVCIWTLYMESEGVGGYTTVPSRVHVHVWLLLRKLL